MIHESKEEFEKAKKGMVEKLHGVAKEHHSLDVKLAKECLSMSFQDVSKKKSELKKLKSEMTKNCEQSC